MPCTTAAPKAVRNEEKPSLGVTIKKKKKNIYYFLWVEKPRAAAAAGLAPNSSIDPWPSPRLQHPLSEQDEGPVAP